MLTVQSFWFRSQLTGECEPCYDVRAQTSDEGSGEFDGTVEDDSEQASILGLDSGGGLQCDHSPHLDRHAHQLWAHGISCDDTDHDCSLLDHRRPARCERETAGLDASAQIHHSPLNVCSEGLKDEAGLSLGAPAVEDDSFSSKTGHEQGRHVRESAQEAPPLDEDDDGRPNKRRSTGRATFGLGLGADWALPSGCTPLHAQSPD